MMAIIPARGGSKGVPRKNIKLLGGKPLIAYTIESARSAGSIDRVILSTDDEEIARVARKSGAEVPFMRPQELARDDSLAIDSYIYTIDKLNSEDVKQYDEFVVLQPTSPFRTAEDIDKAVELFYEKKADSVISVCAAQPPPLWAKKIDSAGCLRNYFNIDVENKNRQALDTAYMLNGAIFILRLPLLKSLYSYYSGKTYAYIMPPERSVDIDRTIDFEFAEFLIERRASAGISFGDKIT